MTDLDSVFKKQSHDFANKGPSSQSYGFSSGHVRIWETTKKVEREEWMLLYCCAGEDSWEFVGLQEDQTSQS